MSTITSIFGDRDWESRLDSVLELLLALNRTADPREMNQIITQRIEQSLHRDRTMVVTRRDVPDGKYLVTRFSEWGDDAPDPWTERDKLPLLEGGIIGELFDSARPMVLTDFDLDKDDPAYEYLRGVHSMMTVPSFDDGETVMIQITMRTEPPAFSPEILPELFWSANLYSRAIHNLRLGEELQAAYDQIDREFETVSNIQISLLPAEVPKLSNADLSVHYETAQRAGGDYYDFFPLPDGRLGILIADVCGHGPAAAVLMAVTHALAHTFTGDHGDPAAVINYLNENLHTHYTHESKSFVTAFYGVLDADARQMIFARAGHDPPRLRTAAGTVRGVVGEASLPLGIEPEQIVEAHTLELGEGAVLVLYTDGITEAHDADHTNVGVGAIDQLLAKPVTSADGLKDRLLEIVDAHTGGAPPTDDRTLVIVRVTA